MKIDCQYQYTAEALETVSSGPANKSGNKIAITSNISTNILQRKF